MALTGSKTCSFSVSDQWNYGGGSRYHVKVTWTQTKNVTGGYSTIKYNVDLTVDSDLLGNATNQSITITWGGEAVNQFTLDPTYYAGTYRIATGVVADAKFYHAADGTCNVSLNWSGYMLNKSVTVELEPIFKAATITSATAFTDENNPTIKYYNPVGTEAKYLGIAITWTGAADIGYYQVPIVQNGTYTFNLTTAERNKIRTAAANTSSFPLKYSMWVIHSDDSEYFSTYDATCSIVNADPDLSPTVTDTDEEATNVTKDASIILFGISDMQCVFNATAKKGASITGYYLKNGSQTISNKSVATFLNVDSPTFEFTVTDSRGNTASKTVTNSFISYVPLTINVDVGAADFIDDTNVKTPYTIHGKYYNGYFGQNPNTLSVEYRYKVAAGSWSSWKMLTTNVSGDNYTCSVSVSATYTDTIQFEARATDKLSTEVATARTASSTPVFDWGAEDFNFNVPVDFKDGITANGKDVPSIEAQGTSGIWTYRKWSDGTAECWGTKAINVTKISNAWGSLFSSGNISAARVAFPFTFTEVPTVIAVLDPLYAAGVLMPAGTNSYEASTKYTGSYEIIRGSSYAPSGGINYKISYMVKGKWK